MGSGPAPTRDGRTLFGIACLCVLGLTAFLGTSAPSVGAAETLPGQGFLPDNRAWELVSPPDKNGGEVMPLSLRTRAASDGSAVQFLSLVGFGDVAGMGSSTDYLAQRSTSPDPGTNGWATHGIIPPQESLSVPGNAFNAEPRYVGDFSADLDQGVFSAWTPLTAAPNVAEAINLYRRGDLRTPGPGSYQLLTDSTTFIPAFFGLFNVPSFAGASTDFDHLIFESALPLTDGAGFSNNVYEWDHGTVRLASILPNGEAGPESIAGHGVSPYSQRFTAHPISTDGSRITFTVQSNQGTGNLYSRINGRATVQLNASERAVPDSPQPAEYWDASADGSRVFFTSGEALTDDAPEAGGKAYMWEKQEDDERQQVAIDAGGGSFKLSFNGVSTEPIAFDAPAAAVQSALEALKGPAPAEEPLIVPGNVTVEGGSGDIGATTPYTVTFTGDLAGANVAELVPDGSSLTGGTATATVTTTQPVENLVLLSVDHQPGDAFTDAEGVIGASRDGRYVYFAARGQLAPGGPVIGVTAAFYLWHEGTITYIGNDASFVSDKAMLLDGSNERQKQVQVTADGRHLLFVSSDGDGLLSVRGGADYDHGQCTGITLGCQQLYLYSADTDQLDCLSCKPGGGTGTTHAETRVEPRGVGGVQYTNHLTRPLSDDGRYAFFSTAEKLLPQDNNGQIDAYLYDNLTDEPRLLSSGEDSSASYFLDASADGRDAFIVTRERLSGWDVDGAYDLYDARADGGFPEPPLPPPSCQGDACQPAPVNLNDPTPASSAFEGTGNQRSPGRTPRCGKGKRRVKARNGKTRCVRKQGKRTANENRRVGR